MNEGEQNNINRISVKIPPFWPIDPELWFSQIENQFALAGISADETKFNYVAGHLDAKYAAEVRDILTNPPVTEKYLKLKTELILRLSSSQDQKTRQLLEHEEMGDRKPTQFLRHLRSLAGTVVPDTVLKPLWLTRLPTSTQAILATQANSDLDALAVLADAVLAANQQARPQVAETTVSTSTLETMMERLTILMTSKIGEVANTLRKEMAEIREDQHQHQFCRSRSRSSSHPRSRSHSSSQHHDGVCWYHQRFGDKATRCTKPCQYVLAASGNEMGSR